MWTGGSCGGTHDDQICVSVSPFSFVRILHDKVGANQVAGGVGTVTRWPNGGRSAFSFGCDLLGEVSVSEVAGALVRWHP